MNIIDAVLCADVIEDATLDGGLTKVRAKLNKVYGRIDRSTQQSHSHRSDDVYEGLENSDQYDEAFYERLESGQFEELGVPIAGVGPDEDGLPGIPVFG
jgi:aromatic ring-opening dioxygenase LigB subunit